MRSLRSSGLLLALAIPLIAAVALLAFALGGGLGAAYAAAIVAGFVFLAFDAGRHGRRLAVADTAERERIVARTEQDVVTWSKAMAVLFVGFPAVMIVVLVVWGVIAAVSALR